MPDFVEQHLERESALRSERMLLDDLISKINRYVTPYDFDPQSEEMPGAEKGQSILDGTGQDGLSTAVNTIIGAMVPTDVRNFSLVPEDEELKKIDAVNAWWDMASSITFRAISTSNIRSMSRAPLKDAYAKGTGSLMMGNAADNSRLLFRGFPIGSYCIAENDEGFVDTHFQRMKMTVRNLGLMAKKLGKRASLSTQVSKLLDDGKLDRKIKILHACYPRDDIKLSSVKRTTPPWKMPFASVWIDAEHKHLIHEGGYVYMPYKDARWHTYAGYPYGFSPLMDVLADVKTLNKMKELTLMSISKAVNPTLLISQNEPLIKRGKKFRTYPGENIIMRDINGMKPFEQGNRVDVADFAIKDLQLAIQKGLGVDRMQIEPPTGDTQRSAMEIAHRIATNNRQLGPGLSRLEDEFLEPIVITAFQLLYMTGKIPKAPSEVFRPGTGFMDIAVRFEGTLARQARQVDVDSIMNFVQILLAASQVDPYAADNFNLDYLWRLIPQALGINQAVLNSEDDVIVIRTQREAEVKAQRQEAALAQAGELMVKAGQTAARNGQAQPQIAAAA